MLSSSQDRHRNTYTLNYLKFTIHEAVFGSFFSWKAYTRNSVGNHLHYIKMHKMHLYAQKCFLMRLNDEFAYVSKFPLSF